VNLRHLALGPVVVLIASIFVTLFLDLSDKIAFNPPYLLLSLNLILWTIATLAIAFISAKSYTSNGSKTLLFLSSSIIIFGISVIISGWVSTFSGNLSVAISNPCLLVASMLQVLSSILSYRGRQETKISNRKGLLTIVYLSSVIFVIINSIVVLLGPYPAFFTASGPTLLRQIVLGSSVFLFAIASLIFGFQYLRSKAIPLYWYALAIGLLSIGLFSAFEVKALGDAPTWLGRITLYVGTSYLLAAILTSRPKPGSSTDFAGAWAESFGNSRDQFSALFANLLNGFIYAKIITDTSGKPVDWLYLDVNNSFERIVGLKKSQVLGKRASVLFSGAAKDTEQWAARYGQVALAGEPMQFEAWRETIEKWLSVSVYSPKKGYFVSIFENITERKKAEEALRLSETRFSKAFNLSPFAMIITRYSDGAYIDVNDTFLKMFEYSRNEVIGHTANELGIYVKPDGRAAYLASFKNGRVSDFEVDLKTKTGKFIKALGFAEAINLNGQDLSIGTLVDITERKQAEEKLEEYRNNLERLVEDRTKKLELSSLYARNLIEASLDPLVTISREGKITDVNKATEDVTGCSREELVGSDFSDYFTEPEKANVGYKQVLAEGFVTDYPLAIKQKSGKITFVLYNASIYKNPQGEIEGVFAAARDITKQKKAEAEAQEIAKKLKDSERLAAIGATAGMVGHDIRNPLQAITSDVYLAKTELAPVPDSEEKKNALESLGEIQKNIDYINKIVQDLQDYARPLNPIAKETDLKQVCEDVLFKIGAPKSIKTSCHIKKDAKQVIADPDLLKRVITNLVTNAVQAMPEGGKLDIRASKQENDVVIEVQDTGVGIPEEAREKLFTPLFTTKSKGQGFGLTVVKRVTESMNGTITFESQTGKGTTFIVRLPPPKEIDGKLVFKRE
jgi:PAS domain S-box-containing protein